MIRARAFRHVPRRAFDVRGAIPDNVDDHDGCFAVPDDHNIAFDPDLDAERELCGQVAAPACTDPSLACASGAAARVSR
jgi:hypothetical protein